jgi:asparagine synthase (glutamine-hydrolysing)
MPGIVGLITRLPRDAASRQLRQMLGAMDHESFYVTGSWVDETLGIYVGWVARKGSFSESMPARNERRDRVLVFAGEEFPDAGTKSRLKKIGHDFDESGAEYLVHLAEEEEAFPRSLNGRFHGLLANLAEGTAVLFNDRYGMGRVYLYESRAAIYFAAEAKAILAVCPELRQIDRRSLGEFITCGAVLENRTLFREIKVLPPASAWTFRNGSVESKNIYFRPDEWENQEPLDEESFYQEFRDVFARNLPRYFKGPERLAMSLTGGLDTRMIMAWKKSEPGTLPCYTFGSMMRQNEDVRVAGLVAQACQQPFQVITSGAEFLSDFAMYAERSIYLTDGCAEVSRSPDVYINERARQIAPVRMTGNYGGEILRRVRTFKPVEPLPGLFSGEILPEVRKARETFTRNAQGHPVSFAAFKQCPWNHYGILAIEQSRLALRTPFLDNDLVKVILRAPVSILNSNETSLRLISDGNAALSRIPTDRGLGGGRWFASEVALRCLLEFQFKAEYAYDVGMPQWMARLDSAVSRVHLERLFLGRHKVFHFRVWYRDFLAGYIQEMLLDPVSSARWYIEPKALEGIVREHVKGRRNYTNEIHKVLSLELLHRLFLDKKQPSLRLESAEDGVSVC